MMSQISVLEIPAWFFRYSATNSLVLPSSLRAILRTRVNISSSGISSGGTGSVHASSVSTDPCMNGTVGVRRVDWTSDRVGRETLPRLWSHSVELLLGKRSHSLRLRDGTDPSPTASPLTWTPCLRLQIARRS